MKKKKILYVITSLGLGGAERLLLTYVKDLDPQKYSFYVCALREKPNDLSGEISKYAEVTNLKINNRFNPFVIFPLLRLIRKINPDIIHTHLFQARVYTTLAKLFYNNSILITQKHNRVNPIKHNVFILLESLCLHFNKKIIAISQSVSESLSKYEFVPKRKIYLLQNCIDYQNFRKNAKKLGDSKEKHLILGYVGRLEKQKGVKYLVMAMKFILSKYPNAKLEVIGDGSELPKLEELSKKINISNSVNFFGKFTDVIPFYSRMDIFILPSVYEGFGIVLLEAMASGIPIVATSVDGIKEVVINNNSGILVPSKNPEALAEAIVKIIEDSDLKRNLIDEGIRRAKLFDVKEHLMKLENLYQDLSGEES